MTPHGKNEDGRLLSVLVPAYNERPYLRRCIERVLAAPLPAGLRREVIVVDDGSDDGTAGVIAELVARHPEAVRAFALPRNEGKGAALRRAIAEMRGQYAIFQDADLEYDPEEYGALLKPLLEGLADVVYGSRFATRAMRQALDYRHALGNMLLTALSNLFTNLYLTDVGTCYKAFRADVLKTIPLRSNRFGVEAEITAKIAKRNCVVYEIPISYRGRSYSEGKKAGWRDGVSALGTILKYWVIDDCYESRYGQAILDSIAGARRFNQWMVRTIRPHLGQRILEVGSGIGNISRMLPKKELLTVTDVDPVYLQLLEDAFRDNDVVDLAKLDLTRDEDFATFGERRYDTIVCLNVLEHIEDDLSALRRMRQLLAHEGRLVLLVPQYPWLYGEYDRRMGHHRRYTRAGLAALLSAAGYRTIASRSFNALGLAAWWFSDRVLRRSTMGRLQLKLFDLLVTFARPVESVFRLPGLSLIAVARPDPSAPQ